jgi:hypothetical protein
LILTVFEQELGAMLAPLRALEAQVGIGTPRGNLVEATKALQKFHAKVVPMLCSMFAEADLLAGFQETLAARQKGPHGAVGRLAAYVRAEQDAGRVSGSVDADFAGAALMAGSFFGAFQRSLLGQMLPALTPARLVESLLPEQGARD